MSGSGVRIIGIDYEAHQRMAAPGYAKMRTLIVYYAAVPGSTVRGFAFCLSQRRFARQPLPQCGFRVVCSAP
jgi:hypothetical protein